MRYAIIDNSILTAVQRIMGEITVKDKHLIDGDILALESFIEAILFYDKLFYLDDYKEEYKYSRQQYFNRLLPISPSEDTYNRFLNEAKKITESIVPCVEGGFIRDSDFKPFFDLLKMNVVFSWDMSSSEYYLNVKMLERVGGLDIKKYSKLSTMIFSEISDKTHKNQADGSKFLLCDLHGQVIKKGYRILDENDNPKEPGISAQVRTFFAGLNWLAFRTAFYTMVSKETGAELFLHPIRNAFQVNLLSKLRVINPPVYSPLIEAMNGIAGRAINRITSVASPLIIKQDLPLFTAWLAKKTGDPLKFIDTAYELREEKVFLDARRQLIELEDLLQKGDEVSFLREANSLIGQVQNTMQKICADFKIETPQGNPITSLISLWNVSTVASGLPSVPINGDQKIINSLREFLPAKGFKALYRSLAKDLTQISTLNKYHEVISSRVSLHEDATFYDSKKENEEFLRVKSYWKIPM